MAVRARASWEGVLSAAGVTGVAAKGTATGIVDIATEAAARLNLTHGRDNKWRGRCPACGYAKHTLELAVEQDRIAVSCTACGQTAAIAAAMGVASDLVTKPTVRSSKVAGALDAWRKATPAAGSLVEAYLKTRGITLPPPTFDPFPAAAAKLERRQNLPRNDFACSARAWRR